MPEFKVEKEKCQLVTVDKVIWFGKHKGATIRQILDKGDYQYIEWCIQQEIFELDADGEELLSESRMANGESEDIFDQNEFDDGFEFHHNEEYKR
jgi:hypothetical protein